MVTNNNKINLNEVFLVKDKQIEDEQRAKKTVEWQLGSLGHHLLNKRAMMYDRNLSSKLAKKYIYSDVELPANELTARKIVDTFILKKRNQNFLIDLDMYTDPAAIADFKQKLTELIVQFIALHRTCPYRVFLHCYCKNDKVKEAHLKKVSNRLLFKTGTLNLIYFTLKSS